PAGRARWPCAHARSASVPVEECEVGARSGVAHGRLAGLLGAQRLPQLRRPVERTAVLGRLTRLRWQVATVAEILVETPGAKPLARDLPAGSGHTAGQPVDLS